MAHREVNDLIRFLGETAQELSIAAVMASAEKSKEMRDEAEEIMALRSNLLQRVWDDEMNAQMHLPLSIKEAA